MPSPWGQSARAVTVWVLTAAFAVPLSLSGQTHVVSLAELHQEAVSASRARQADLQKVAGFLSSPEAAKALRSVGMDSGRIKAAAATLSDQELAQLAARSEKAQADFAAGALSDRDLLVILVGIAALILIIVAVR